MSGPQHDAGTLPQEQDSPAHSQPASTNTVVFMSPPTSRGSTRRAGGPAEAITTTSRTGNSDCLGEDLRRSFILGEVEGVVAKCATTVTLVASVPGEGRDAPWPGPGRARRSRNGVHVPAHGVLRRASGHPCILPHCADLSGRFHLRCSRARARSTTREQWRNRCRLDVGTVVATSPTWPPCRARRERAGH